MFNEQFFAYRFGVDGMHDGKTLVSSADEVTAYIKDNINTHPEIRLTDMMDNLVLHIQDHVWLWPPQADGTMIKWNVVRQTWERYQASAVPDTAVTPLTAPTPPGCCVSCKQVFSHLNVKTPLGWKETKISGMCENCWDEMFADDDSDGEDPEDALLRNDANSQGM